MDERDSETPEATTEAPATPPTYAGGEDAQGGVNLPLLGVLLVILALVIASNVWLRRRAERENAERGED
jgi:hypothetical protein